MARRPFSTHTAVLTFLIEVLRYNDDAKTSNLAKRLRDAEVLSQNESERNTLVSDTHRDAKYSTAAKRGPLCQQIIEELYTLKRLSDDSKTLLGKGGALPRHSKLRYDAQAICVIGPPAAGKSRVANAIAEHFSALVVDSDFAKMKLPEFDGGQGASKVHEESDALMFNASHLHGKVIPLLERAVNDHANVVIPKVGRNLDDLEVFQSLLADKGYKTHLVLISLDRHSATRRAIDRFIRTGRYVSPVYVFDEVAHEPQLTYYRTMSDDRKSRSKRWNLHAAYRVDNALSMTMHCCSDAWPVKQLDRLMRAKRR